ncbi:MAG: VOC family protein [Actinobacteria bacterium]|nr:VOC family protein [Actinomycetota bacterium]
MADHVFHHASLAVSDLEASTRFYSLLGFTPGEAGSFICDGDWMSTMTGYPNVELRIAWLEMTGMTLELIEYARPDDGNPKPPVPKDVGSAHIGLVVDDLDAEYARLSAAGVAFRSEPVSPPASFGMDGKAVYAIDPDGNNVELIMFLSEA